MSSVQFLAIHYSVFRYLTGPRCVKLISLIYKLDRITRVNKKLFKKKSIYENKFSNEFITKNFFKEMECLFFVHNRLNAN